jgi:wyosine [tRNA(Phe)-imidazoG37] synthetase (radical SAM superfamily)
VIQDLNNSQWQQADIITFSGSGEPTLALNLKEILEQVKAITHKPTLVLTNGTTLDNPEVQDALMLADNIAVKLDAASNEKLQQMNRPVEGVTLEKIITATKQFKQIYPGKLSIQTMFMPTNLAEAKAIAAIVKEIAPDELQLNTPKRPYPLSWHVDSRGNHVDNPEYESVKLNTISIEEANAIEELLRNETGVKVISIYPKQ